MAELLPETHRLRNESFEAWQTDAAKSLAYLPLGRISLGNLGLQLAEENQDAFLPNFNHGRVSIPHKHRDNDNTAVIPFISGVDERMYLMSSFKRRLNAKTPSKLQTVEGVMMGTFSKAFESAGALFNNKWIGGRISRDLGEQTVAGAHCTNLSLTRPQQISRTSIFFVVSEIDQMRNIDPMIAGAVANHEYVHTIDAKTHDMGRYFTYYTEARAYYVERQIMPPPERSSPRTLQELWELSDQVEGARYQYNIPHKELLEGTFEFTKKHNGYSILGGKPVKFRRS